jgi:hypothetical protein
VFLANDQLFRLLGWLKKMAEFDLLKRFVTADGPPKKVELESDDPEVALLFSNYLSKQGKVKHRANPQHDLLNLLHKTRQEEIGGILFQVLSELNSELQLCAGSGEKLSYESYCALRSKVSKRLRRWLTTKIFLCLRDGEKSEVDIHALYDFFYSIGCMVKTRLTLQSYQDPSQPMGWLRESDVERWILDLYPSITIRSSFAQNDPEFLAVYSAAATRCFFFFLDPQKLDRVSIDTLVASPITDALLEVTLTAEEDALSEAELRELSNNW